MKLLVLAFIVTFTTSSAFAHFKIGTYGGTNDLGLNCDIEFVEKTFLPAVKNPLNERVIVKVHKLGVFAVGHQAIVDSDSKSVKADKSRLVGALGLKDSAMALEIKMGPNNGGPEEFNIILHNWKSDRAIMYSCDGLEFIK